MSQINKVEKTKDIKKELKNKDKKENFITKIVNKIKTSDKEIKKT